MLRGLTENHERSLLASIQYAARPIRDCDDVLTGSGGSDPLSRYTKALSTPQEKIARDYLFRLREQLLRALHAEFEGQSRPLLTPLTGAPTSGAAKTSTTITLQRDLEWLRQDRVEMTHVRD